MTKLVFPNALARISRAPRGNIDSLSVIQEPYIILAPRHPLTLISWLSTADEKQA